jgi:hypothetical protein
MEWSERGAAVGSAGRSEDGRTGRSTGRSEDGRTGRSAVGSAENERKRGPAPNGPRERACWVCGKHFMIRDEWVYRRYIPQHGVSYFCSWGHMRKYDMEVESKTKGKRPPRGNGKGTRKAAEIVRMLEEGYTHGEVMKALNVSETTVRYYDIFHKQTDY